MERRRLESLGIDTSLMGYGCMRFPLNLDGTINESEAEQLLDQAIAGGVTYIDTAYPYHEQASEPFVGRVLNKYPRDSYTLATKMPLWAIETLEDAKRIFAHQLERLDKDYVDFYLFHAVNRESFEKIKTLNLVAYMEELKETGKIRYIGFSFHDDYEVYEELIHYYKWDFCQIQLNYMDTQMQAGLKGYELATSLNIPVVIMEPVKGGSLANFSDEINEMFQQVCPNMSIASWAIRYVAGLPNVKVILSGMSTKEQVADNLATCSPFVPLSEQETDVIGKVVKTLSARIQNGCTGCSYCMPCPVGVNIPKNFELWNTYHIYKSFSPIDYDWNNNLDDSSKAKSCVECGKCETVCPQQIPIREDLKKLQIELEEANKKKMR
ncbi:MAG: aldo/keto reductase [Eubacteriales bacterium]